MNTAEEVETVAAYRSSGVTLVNDLSATYVTPFVRYYYDFDVPLASST